jgi:hypothetical protein
MTLKWSRLSLLARLLGTKIPVAQASVVKLVGRRFFVCYARVSSHKAAANAGGSTDLFESCLSRLGQKLAGLVLTVFQDGL